MDPEIPAEVRERYQVGALLGRGGMGVVYRATHPELDRPCALKLHTGPLDRQTVERVSREARVLSRVRHPNLVEIFDFGVAPCGPWMVMELIEGTPSDRFFATFVEGDVVRLARLACEVAGALAALHAESIVHRDVKPANIMIESGGRTVLMDLGLALDANSTRITATGGVVGTLAFMAPEQLLKGRSGPPADYFGLGATLYTLWVGRPGNDPRSIMESLSTMRWPGFPAVPGELAETPLGRAIAALTREDPGTRPASPAEVAALVAGTVPLDTRTAVRPRPAASHEVVPPNPLSPSELRSAWSPLRITAALVALAASAGFLLHRPWRAPAPGPATPALPEVQLAPSPEAPTGPAQLAAMRRRIAGLGALAGDPDPSALRAQAAAALQDLEALPEPLAMLLRVELWTHLARQTEDASRRNLVALELAFDQATRALRAGEALPPWVRLELLDAALPVFFELGDLERGEALVRRRAEPALREVRDSWRRQSSRERWEGLLATARMPENAAFLSPLRNRTTPISRDAEALPLAPHHPGGAEGAEPLAEALVPDAPEASALGPDPGALPELGALQALIDEAWIQDRPLALPSPWLETLVRPALEDPEHPAHDGLLLFPELLEAAAGAWTPEVELGVRRRSRSRAGLSGRRNSRRRWMRGRHAAAQRRLVELELTHGDPARGLRAVDGLYKKLRDLRPPWTLDEIRFLLDLWLLVDEATRGRGQDPALRRDSLRLGLHYLEAVDRLGGRAGRHQGERAVLRDRLRALDDAAPPAPWPLELPELSRPGRAFREDAFPSAPGTVRQRLDRLGP